MQRSREYSVLSILLFSIQSIDTEPEVFYSGGILREGLLKYYMNTDVVLNMNWWYYDYGEYVTHLHTYDDKNVVYRLATTS